LSDCLNLRHRQVCMLAIGLHFGMLIFGLHFGMLAIGLHFDK